MTSDADDAVVGRQYPTYKVGWLQPTPEKTWFCEFFIGILICVNNGACFVFGIFSPYMKMGGFQYNQSQIDTVSTVGVLLSYFSMPAGFLYDRYGPSVTLLVGSTLNVTGWAGMYVIFKNMEHPLLSNRVVVMAFFFGLSQLSASFYETGSVLTNLKSFSCYQGRVILIQKTFMGLGSSLVAQMYVAFFEKTMKSIAPFFAFLCLYSTVVGALGVRYLRLPTAETRCVGLNVEDEETKARGGGEPHLFRRPFNVGTVILCISVAFVLTTTMIENFATLTNGVRVMIGVATVLLCLAFTAMIFTTPSYEVNRRDEHASDETDRVAVVLLDDEYETHAPHQPALGAATEDHRCAHADDEDLAAASEEVAADAASQSHRSPSSAEHKFPLYGSTGAAASAASPVAATLVSALPDALEDVEAVGFVFHLNDESLWVNVRHREMWLLWFVCFGAWSAMTVVSSNSSQIYQAIAYDSFSLTVNTVFVSIYGVASAVGRIIVGALHPHLERRRLPISALLPLAPLLNVIGLPMFMFAPSALLFVPFFVVGLGVGFSWGSTVLIITSLFTTTNCGKHYSFLYTAGMLSPLVFNMALFGPLYDHYGELQGHGDNGSCEGVVCIATPLLVCTAVNALAAPLAYLFYTRTSARRGIVYTPAT